MTKFLRKLIPCAVIFYAHMCTFLNKINGIVQFVHINGMDYVWICINNKLQELFSLYMCCAGVYLMNFKINELDYNVWWSNTIV